AARDGNAFVVIVLQRPLGAADGIDEAHGKSRAVGSWRIPDGAGGSEGIGVVEQEGAFFDRPAVVAAKDNAVNLLDVVLSNVSMDEVAGNKVETKPIWVAHAQGVNLSKLACAGKWVACRDAILSVGADNVRTAGRERRINGIESEEFAQ